MAARIVKAWRGVVRANLKACAGKANALLAYNTKHPQLHFLTTQQVTDLLTTVSDCNALLAATKPR